MEALIAWQAANLNQQRYFEVKSYVGHFTVTLGILSPKPSSVVTMREPNSTEARTIEIALLNAKQMGW